jgi:hypothetical protein
MYRNCVRHDILAAGTLKRLEPGSACRGGCLPGFFPALSKFADVSSTGRQYKRFDTNYFKNDKARGGKLTGVMPIAGSRMLNSNAPYKKL